MATAKQWKTKLKKAMNAAGTYDKCFDVSIATLADILERKDAAAEIFAQSGGTVVVEHTNKAGATNLERNPCVRIIEQCEQMALSYLRELGLTPAGRKRINDEADDGPQMSALDMILYDLEDDKAKK